MSQKKTEFEIIGISRVRNESLIIEDTIRHMEGICDGLIFYDDSSTDETVALINKHSKKLIHLIEGEVWSIDRVGEETRHRAILYEKAAQNNPDWIFCFDADERYTGNIRQFLLSDEARDWDALRIRLFDAYLTSDSDKPYTQGSELAKLERKWGPERRDILMIRRNDSDLFFYQGLDRREPEVSPAARILSSGFRCKHFGKGISIRQWEDTCDYYSTYFPEPYRTRWKERKGKALHDLSDTGRPLYTWDEVEAHGVIIHPLPVRLEESQRNHIPKKNRHSRVGQALRRLPGLVRELLEFKTFLI